MTRHGAAVAFIMLNAGSMAGCAAPPPVSEGAPRAVDKLILAPLARHEECVQLARGDRIDYRFESDVPLSFNIHYQEGNAVVIPISRDRTLGDSGVFPVVLPERYCLMWEAASDGATLTYRVALRRGPS